MNGETRLTIRQQFASRINGIARAHLEFGMSQIELTYELIARELEPADAEANDDFIRSTIAHWNRPIVHFVRNAGDSQALCGWTVDSLKPILDGAHSFRWSHYNCYQHEACPACWRLTHLDLEEK